jgi:uracil-DNA glycosylase family protein
MAKRTAFTGAASFIPASLSLPALHDGAQKCEGCDLYREATQAVFGEGSSSARIVFVGEQPGNEEDKQGHPFVGPAGRILDSALEEAGIDRAAVYVTNAVKHFRFEERGKWRIHKRPSTGEVNACEPWLQAEFRLIKPEVIVCLGATAARALLGSKFRLTEERGKPLSHEHARHLVATIHPSAILRIPDPEERHQEYARFVADLKKVRSLLK